jgi:FixJ family two-component response regulator
VTAATRVLVVDDSADMRLSLGHLLGLLGYEVETAGDGNAALAAQRRACAIVITDIFIGRQGRPRDDRLGDALHIGADAALHKPFTLLSLKQALDRRA